ncbi:SesB protein [Apiospora hydei]|uniref:SesB protein n=1 Tax=Apiospora hydei TaxID=1337664 RepID=A0ABR1VJY5_9PEZI
MRKLNLLPTPKSDTGRGSRSVFWPRDLLPTTVSNARVMTYGYDSHIRHRLGPERSRSTVYDIAWDFLVALEASRRSDPERPISLIAHSLGGIVVKEMLRKSSTCGQSHLRPVFSSMVGVVFFGTPHGGADPRSFLKTVAEHLLRATGFTVNQQIADTLLPSSERLRELRDEFAPMARQQGWAIHSFQEQTGVKALNGGKVVEDTSSYLNAPDLEVTEHIFQNHMEMCRFVGPHDPEYRKVAAAISRIMAKEGKAKTDPDHVTKPHVDSMALKAIMDSLRFDQDDARHQNIKSAHAKTCKWLLKSDTYSDWVKS